MGINVSNNKIEELYLKYMNCYNIERDDYQNLLKYIEKKKEEDKLEEMLNNYHGYFKEDEEFESLKSCLNYILNSYPPEAYKKENYRILKEIKNTENENKMYTIIVELISEYQKSLNNLSNNNNSNNNYYQLINKILTFLNNIKKEYDKYKK